jgi:gluconolactonase
LPVLEPGVIDATEYSNLVPNDISFLVGALTTPALLDSLAVNAVGNVLVGTCIWHPGITEFDLAGRTVAHHVMPDEFWDPFVTNICFGGEDLRTAYITSSGYGRLLAADCSTPGLALYFGGLSRP